MKHLSILKTLVIVFSFLCMYSCVQDSCTEHRTFVRYNPVSLSVDDFRRDVLFESSRPLKNPGKFYFFNNHIFINELGQGIHIYDITQKESPVNIGFYNIPGNFDIAIKGNTLYADNVIDLISLDISNIREPRLLHRELDYNKKYSHQLPTRIFAYNTKSQQTIVVNCEDENFRNDFFIRDGVFFAAENNRANVFANNTTSNSNGTGGSFARFTIVGNHLMTVDHSTLRTYDISNPNKIQSTHDVNLGWGIETIFPYKDKLFIGSNSGMFIFDNSIPGKPKHMSTFEHARACDPVVVNENTAYVTLRNGNLCQGFINQMDVIDISNLHSPKLIKTYPMIHPHGLSYSDNRVFLSEGVHGFKVLDVTKSNQIKTLHHIKGIHSYDMISLSKDLLFMVGDGGFYIYNVENKETPKLISQIKVEP